ncbi:MAG: FkbM family methyltransferase [Acutalibacteraceae bacterium]
MIERIYDNDAWQTLKNSRKPIILYGMGNGADQIIEVLNGYGLDFADVFASDGFVRGQLFHGKKVLTLSQAEEKYEDFIIVMTFAVHDEKTLGFVRELSKRHTLLSPTVPVSGTGLITRQFVEKHDSEYDKAFSLLCDEKSKESFLNVLRFTVSGNTDYLFSVTSEKKEVYSDILKLTANEKIVDLGAYNGDTVNEFLEATNGQYDRILALEPDEKNFRKLLKNTDGLKNIVCQNLGAWDKDETLFFEKKSSRSSHKSETGVPVHFTSVDSLVREEISFIKMDIEGAEGKALDGAANTIRQYKPKLYVCAYHRNEDLFALPLKINSIQPGYSFFFRHHPYIPAWESNFYCVYNQKGTARN